jgi:molecular chaperone GrpE
MSDDKVVDLTAPVDEAVAKIEHLERQVADYKLLMADMQNSTRRLKEDSDRQKKYFAEPLARDVLAIIDNLERARDAAVGKGETGILVDGIGATIGATIDMLKRHSVRKIDVEQGSPFDPNLHMAVSQQPTNDIPAGDVYSVLQSGFTFHDRVLRPATVIVASDPPVGGTSEPEA